MLLLAVFVIGAASAAAYQINASQSSHDEGAGVSIKAGGNMKHEVKDQNDDDGDKDDEDGVQVPGAKDEDKDDENNDKDEKVVGTASISEADAKEIALKTYKGDGAITNIKLEMEDKVLVYGVEFTEKDGNEVDVKINAKTGAVVKVESDKDEEEKDK